LELHKSEGHCFAKMHFAFDGCGMVHVSMQPYAATAYNSMVMPESSLDFPVRCDFKLGTVFGGWITQWRRVNGRTMLGCAVQLVD
jgi:hypothetical protein